MASKTSPHHIFSSGSPLCGVKGKALIAATSASPVAQLCGRCLLVQKARAKDATLVNAVVKAVVAAPVVESNPDAPMPIYTPAAVAENNAKSENVLPFPVYDMTKAEDRAAFMANPENETTKPISLAAALNKPKKTMPLEVKAKLAKVKAEPKPVKTFLLNPEIVYKANGKVDTITGTCPECKTNKRTIHAADAFQVKRCVECQKKAISQRVNTSRKAKTAEAK